MGSGPAAARRPSVRSHGLSARVRREIRLSSLAARSALVGFYRGNDLTHAAAIAFYSLLSLFPFLLLVTSVFGSVAADAEDRTAVLSFVLRYFPGRYDFLTDQLDDFTRSRIQIGVAGAIGLVWGSLGVFGAVTTAVNEAWGVERHRGFWKHRLASFLMLVAAGGVLIVALLLVSASHVMTYSVGLAWADSWWLATLRSLVLQYLATVVLVLALGLVYYFVPNERARFRDVWVGAILTGLLWRAAFDGFSWYVTRNAQLRLVNGSIAVVVVFLLWVYLSSVILMYGVEFTAAHFRARRSHAADAARR